MTRYNDKDITEVPEVRDFMKVQAEVENFKAEHASVFEQFDVLVEDYNQKLDAANKACRSQQASCGPFEYYQNQVAWDADGLFDDLGRERFIQVGGQLKTVTVKSIDKTRVESSAQQGLIPSDVVERRRKVSPRYHTPKKIES